MSVLGFYQFIYKYRIIQRISFISKEISFRIKITFNELLSHKKNWLNSEDIKKSFYNICFHFFHIWKKMTKNKIVFSQILGKEKTNCIFVFYLLSYVKNNIMLFQNRVILFKLHYLVQKLGQFLVFCCILFVCC